VRSTVEVGRACTPTRIAFQVPVENRQQGTKLDYWRARAGLHRDAAGCLQENLAAGEAVVSTLNYQLLA
jgi:hypothetical protein